MAKRDHSGRNKTTVFDFLLILLKILLIFKGILETSELGVWISEPNCEDTDGKNVLCSLLVQVTCLNIQ